MHSCRMLYDDDDFRASDYVNSPYVKNGHRFVERVVQAYDTHGNHKGELDTNRGHGGVFMRMILTYATKSSGY